MASLLVRLAPMAQGTRRPVPCADVGHKTCWRRHAARCVGAYGICAGRPADALHIDPMRARLRVRALFQPRAWPRRCAALCCAVLCRPCSTRALRRRRFVCRGRAFGQVVFVSRCVRACVRACVCVVLRVCVVVCVCVCVCVRGFVHAAFPAVADRPSGRSTSSGRSHRAPSRSWRC